MKDIENNYVGLEIVAESARIEKYEQEASMSRVDLVSNIGGNTGLWIGISFLSLMEVVEMLYRLCRSQMYRISEKIKSFRKKNFEQNHSPV